MIGDVGERDPALLAVEDVAIAPPDRRRLHAAHVAPGRRLREAVAGDLRSVRLRHEVLLLLRFGAPRQQRETVEAGMHRHDHAQRCVDVLELFARKPEADVVHAGAAVLGRHRHAEQAKPRHAAENAVAIEMMRTVVLADERSDFARRPLAYRLFEQALLVGQGEVNHRQVSGIADCRFLIASFIASLIAINRQSAI